jgi:hypothetical protein
VYSTPVAVFVAVTVAPFTRAPVWSVTVPVTLAVTFWPAAGRAASANRIASATDHGHLASSASLPPASKIR